MGGGGNKKELRTELACWKSCSSWGKPGPGVARRKTRAGRGRLGGRRRSSEKRKRWREEEECGGRRGGGGPYLFADSNPSLTVGIKQQVQGASSLPRWKQLTG